MVNKVKSYSISNLLKQQKRSSDEFEVMMNSLSLEEVIALKLELSGKLLKSKMYGFNLWKNTPSIVYDAILKYALSACKSKKDASRYLGINLRTLNNLIKKYKVQDYFENKLDKLID
jgi:hypothetical protein